jgi:hypothetical protein
MPVFAIECQGHRKSSAVSLPRKAIRSRMRADRHAFHFDVRSHAKLHLAGFAPAIRLELDLRQLGEALLDDDMADQSSMLVYRHARAQEIAVMQQQFGAVRIDQAQRELGPIDKGARRCDDTCGGFDAPCGKARAQELVADLVEPRCH